MDENCRLRQGEGYGVCCDAGIDPYGCGGDLQILRGEAAPGAEITHKNKSQPVTQHRGHGLERSSNEMDRPQPATQHSGRRLERKNRA